MASQTRPWNVKKANWDTERRQLNAILREIYFETTYLADGDGAVLRTLRDRAADTINVKDFGANEDNTAAENDVAFQSAFTAAIGRNLLVPAGTYLLSAAIVLTGSPIQILGDGIGVTTLRWISTSATSGIQLTLSSSGGLTGTLEFSHLTLATERAGVGTALKITSPASTSGDRIMPRAMVHHLMMQGVVNPTVDGWLNGLHLSNCTNSTVDSCLFWGKVNGTEPNYTSVSGFIYDNDVSASPHQSAFTFTNCIAHYSQNMLVVGDCEGIIIDKFQFVGVNNGVVVTGPLAYPHISITNGHINASNVGIQISDVQEVFIDKMLMFKELGNFAAYGISLIGAKKGRITDCTFDNLNTNAAGVMSGVVLSATDEFWIHGNTFRKEVASPAGFGVVVTNSTCEDNEIGKNKYETGITPITDSGTRTIQPNMRVLVSRSTIQNFVAATAADVSWDTAQVEVGEFWNIGSPTRLTAPVSGLYRISGNVAWGAGAGGNREILVRKNATAPAPFGVGRSKMDQPAAGGLKHGLTSTLIPLAVNDYVELRCIASVNDDIAAVGTTDTWFAMERVDSV